MEIREALLYIGFAQSVFAAMVLGTRQKVEVADKILTACLITIAFRFLIAILGQESFALIDPNFSVAVIPMTFGPYLYLYTTYLINGSSHFARRDLIHFFPSIFFMLLYFVFYRDHFEFDSTTYFEKDSFLWIRMVFALTFFSSVLVYTIFTFLKLNEFRKQVKPKSSYQNGGFQLIWLSIIALLFSSLFITYLIVGAINALTFKETIDLGIISRVGLTLLAYVTSYFGLRQPSILGSLYDKAIKLGETKNIISETSKKDKISDAKVNDIAEALENSMVNDKLYLNSELTLAQLADSIHVSKSELTYVLNTHLNKNFFSYLNEFRINEVLGKLKDPACDHLTIISIAFDCGFNSKSTFNGIFKQHTGLTPTEYKKRMAVTSTN